MGLPDLNQDGRCGWSGGGLVGRLGADGRGLLSRAGSRVRKGGGPGGYGAGRNTRGIRGSGWYGLGIGGSGRLTP